MKMENNFSDEKKYDATEPLQNGEKREFVAKLSSTNYGIFHQVSFCPVHSNFGEVTLFLLIDAADNNSVVDDGIGGYDYGLHGYFSTSGA